MAPPTDAALIAEARTTPSAFEAVVRRHHISIHRYVMRRLGPADAGLGPADAEDVVSEVFAAAYASRTRYDSARAKHPSGHGWHTDAPSHGAGGGSRRILRNHRRHAVWQPAGTGRGTS